MVSRTVRLAGCALTLEVPDRLAARLRGRGARAGDGAAGATSNGTAALSKGDLVFRNPPAIAPRQRDLSAALAFLLLDEQPITPTPGADPFTSILWYHTMEFPDGRVTAGQFDHRSLVPRYGLPSDMTGPTALDEATFDGFWAFEMERRGADVTAVDLDDWSDFDLPPRAGALLSGRQLPPMGRGFALAHEALGSSVRKQVRSVYELRPDDIGTFDLVHVGDLLLHLRRPLAALEAVRSVTRREALISDVVELDLPGGRYGPATQYLGGWNDVVWWVPSLEALTQMIVDAGFASVRVNAVYQLAKTAENEGFWRASITAVV